MATPAKPKAKSRRPRGSGSLYYEADRNRWVGSVVVNGKRHRVTAKTKTDASAKLAQLTAARTTGGAIDDKRYTVADALDAFLTRDIPNRRRHGLPLSEASVTAYRWAAAVIDEHLGAVKLHALTAEHIEDMFAELAATNRRKTSKPMSAQSLKRIRTTLHQTIAAAVRRQRVSRNVAADIAIPGTARPTQKRRALTPDQARTLLEVLRSERNGLMYGLSLRLGLRPGEASAVTWGDVDSGVLHVRGTKTAASDRHIELPSDVADWVEQHRADTLGNVAPLNPGTALMFTTSAGNRIDASNARRRLRELCESAGVPVVRPNELRHSCASLLSDAGVPNEQIADLLGHTTTRMVEQTYRHRIRPVVDVAARADWTATSS